MKNKFQDDTKKYDNSNRERGITLVALVITIVILIILAVVAINAVFGDSGLLQYAQDARNYQANADISDSELINSATEYIDGIIGGGSTDEPENKSEIEQAKESGETFDDTTTIKDDLENDVTIPGGFHIADDSGTKVEEGIVIEDDDGNQFVWIPVGIYQTTSGEKTNNLSRRTFTESESTEVNEDGEIQESSNSYFYYGEENENSVAKDQIEGFKTSVTSNKGYYIGRYEAGTEIERTSEEDELTIPVVQADKNVYLYITRDQAKTQAEAMYNGNEYVTSELASSYAWDTTLNFICQNSDEGYLLATSTDSTYGNIGTNTKELTGAYEADNYCNIHDLLGNCYEWTTEFCTSSYSPCVARGGDYYDNNGFASVRFYGSTTYSYSDCSFRIQLYIK